MNLVNFVDIPKVSGNRIPMQEQFRHYTQHSDNDKLNVVRGISYVRVQVSNLRMIIL